jgi:hypothetical protein
MLRAPTGAGSTLQHEHPARPTNFFDEGQLVPVDILNVFNR